MSPSPTRGSWRGVVEAAVATRLGRTVIVREMIRRPVRASASHRLEELSLVTENGERIELIAKEVGPGGMSVHATAVKPAHLLDRERETLVYLGALHCAGLGTALCYGAWVEPESGRKWLLLEKVCGTELFQWGELEVWKQACRWLARLHAKFADAGPGFPKRHRLLHLDSDHLRGRMAAARSAVAGSASLDKERKAAFFEMDDQYPDLIQLSLRCRPTLSHGDFYPANILVAGEVDSPRICPVDWEMAAWGPGLADLAALISGAWSVDERRELTTAYLDELRRAGASLPDHFESALQAWRLHVAVQWIGWATDWTPPPEQRQDWLAEALRIAFPRNRLG